jgi:hypothetical protein
MMERKSQSLKALLIYQPYGFDRRELKSDNLLIKN